MIIILWAVDIVVVILMMTRVDGAGKAGRGEVGGLLGRGQEVCQEVWEQVFNLFFWTWTLVKLVRFQRHGKEVLVV